MFGIRPMIGCFRRRGILACLLIIIMMSVLQVRYYSMTGSQGENHWQNFIWQPPDVYNERKRSGYEIVHTGNNNEVKHHIAFLKVHKAASSTVQNIFLRYAMHKDLVVVVPHVNKLFYPNIISTGKTVTPNNILPPPENKSYEVLCCHVLYDRTAFEGIMPSDTVYIGIIREPFGHFVSILNYFRPREVLDINDTLAVSKYLQEPLLYTKPNSKSYVNSRMAREFGFPPDLYITHNESGIELYLDKLEYEFQLVMIVELFDESMILMRRLLNWKLRDVLYVKKNVKHNLFEKIKFTAGDVERYKKWAVLDYALYDRFYQRLQNQIQMQGPDFYEELLHFKRVRRDMDFFCNPMPGVKPSAAYHCPASKWNQPFIITTEDCHYMNIGETAFIKEIRMKQYGI